MTNTLDQRVQAAVRDALATTSQNPSAGINAVAAFIASAALAEVHRQPAVVEPPADQTAVLAATLREVLDTFSPMKDTHDGPVAYYDGSADIEPEQYDRWRAVLDAELRRMADETATTEGYRLDPADEALENAMAAGAYDEPAVGARQDGATS